MMANDLAPYKHQAINKHKILTLLSLKHHINHATQHMMKCSHLTQIGKKASKVSNPSFDLLWAGLSFIKTLCSVFTSRFHQSHIWWPDVKNQYMVPYKFKWQKFIKYSLQTYAFQTCHSFGSSNPKHCAEHCSREVIWHPWWALLLLGHGPWGSKWPGGHYNIRFTSHTLLKLKFDKTLFVHNIHLCW